MEYPPFSQAANMSMNICHFVGRRCLLDVADFIANGALFVENTIDPKPVWFLRFWKSACNEKAETLCQSFRCFTEIKANAFHT